MGCSNSKDNVNPVKDSSQAWMEERNTKNMNNNGKSTSTGIITKSKSTTKPVQLNSKDGIQTLNTNCSASEHSLRSKSGAVNRGVTSAASSKVSAHTVDSGLEEDYLPNMITEESEPEKMIIANKRPPTPDVDIVGTQIPSRNNSSKEGRRQQSSNDILEGLRSEGLLAAFNKRQGGMSFDVMIAPEFGYLKKPPAKLAKLKRKKSKMKELTKEEIDAKIQAAEERRKRKEAKMISKLNKSAKELHAHNVANTNEKPIEDQTEEHMTKSHANATGNGTKHTDMVRLVGLERLAENKPTEEDREEEEAVVA